MISDGFWEREFARSPAALGQSIRLNDRTAAYNPVGIHFFETLGIPMVAGRAFGAGDTAASPKVAVINQRLAAARFPGQNPIGKRVSVGVYAGYGDVLTTGQIEIVGVSGDTLIGRDLRPDGLLGRAAHQGDWHPDGA